jgi:RNA polymerase sigma-70 factor (ECF subfamily)
MRVFGLLVADIIYSNEFMQSAVGLTKNIIDANDLIQTTALIALRFENKFIGGNLYGWLYTILRNTFINKSRFHYHHKTILIEYPELISQEWVEPDIFRDERINGASSDIERLFNEIKKLHKLNREPIEMSLEGYKMHEIAGMIGIPEGTVKSRIFKGKKQLKKSWDQIG